MQPSANNISENLHASSQEGTSTEAGSATNHRPQPLRHLASIHPMHPRPEQQSALQRIGQLDQNLRGCSGQGVLDQVHTNAPLPETIVIPTVTRVTSTRLIPDATQGSELEELSPDTPLIDRELLMHEPESLESPQFEDERILVPPFTETRFRSFLSF